MNKLLVSSCVLLFAFSVFAKATPTEKKVYVTKQINPHPPNIDGRLDDDAWRKVEWQGGFTQREPNDGAEPSQETDFKILYDESNLYIGIRAHDTEPEKIVKRVTRRDRFDGDWVEVNIDSRLDRRTAFSFTVNAAGVRGEEYISKDGDNWDSDWNPIWFAKTAIDDKGWTAEMRIPFSQIRFGKKEDHVWGLQFTRRLFREDERSVWQYIPQNSGGWVSYFGELRGLKGITAPKRIEVMPYGVSDVRRFPSEAGNPFATGRENNFSGGADVKMGVTGDLTLDVTINPDFGQVEADPSEVNLTAFETFFREKRPFFIEGKNILDYRIMTGDGGASNDRLFHSRRIGRSPQHAPDLDDDEFADVPDNTSILTALKLTGKTKSGLSIGVLEAVTAKERANVDVSGIQRKETVEPATNFFLGRVLKDYNEGNTSIGAIFTATNRNLSEAHLKFLNSAAYTGGLDVRRQWGDKTYYLDVRTSFSHIRGDREAITQAQESSARYFQRPDADYVTLDTTRTSMSGHGGFISTGRGGTGKLRLNVGYMWRSPGLELNDMGFLRQADRSLQWSWLGYRWNKPVAIFRSLRLNVNQWWGRNFGGETLFVGGNINGGGQLKNFWSVWAGINREGKNLSTSALRGGPAIKLPANWNNWYNLSTDRRKDVQFGIGGSNRWADDGGSRRNNFRFWVRYRPMDGLQLRVNPFYTFSRRDLQYIDTLEFQSEDRFLFGRIDQKTLGITLRLDYSITPDLSIQYYGQPFISAGRYSRLRRITQPRADTYGDRFRVFNGNEIRLDSEAVEYNFDENLDGTTDYMIDNPDFNFRQFRSNLVVRWEYRPGSTVFLVWTQERSGDDTHGRFSVGDELDNLFGDAATNVFLIKVSRWLSL